MPRRVFIFLKKTGNSVSYLPHRQLRKKRTINYIFRQSYLPHRQLRNKPSAQGAGYAGYLPHRQLRNRYGSKTDRFTRLPAAQAA